MTTTTHHRLSIAICLLLLAAAPAFAQSSDPFQLNPGPEQARPVPRPRAVRRPPESETTPPVPSTTSPYATPGTPASPPVAATPPAAGNFGYANEMQDFGVPPQNTLRTGPVHAPTPLYVPGARTITTTQLSAELTARQPLVMLYVNEDRMGIAGARWLDGAGRGASFDDDIEQRLQQKIYQLTGGNHDTPIVAFCYDPHCWLSYNAALRLVRLGYRNVSWYRGGREAWRAAGLPLTNLSPEPW